MRIDAIGMRMGSSLSHWLSHMRYLLFVALLKRRFENNSHGS
jgi:hypothetical protein